MNAIRIILLGNARVGKSSIIKQLQENKFDQKYHVTITPIKRRKRLEDLSLRKLNLYIFDTVGMENYKNVNRIYMKSNQIALLIYDITNTQSFNDLNYWLNEIMDINQREQIIFSVIANKSDLFEESVISKEEGEEYAKSINALFFETSALDYESIYYMFLNVCEEYLKRNENKENIYNNISNDYIFKKVEYSNGIYIGYLENNKRNGKGRMNYDNGDEYYGEWKNDKKEGTGIMKYDNEDIYNGKWQNDNFINGKITYYNNDEIYDGQIKNNQKNGDGKMTYNNGDFYDGKWKNDKREGYGEMKYNNGDIYEGNWKNNKRNGDGKLIYKKDNKILKGNWIDDQLKHGEIIYSNSEKYEGDINKNKRNGLGKMIINNKVIYDGFWENDKKKGNGKFYYYNGDFYEGLWENDMKNGKGKLKFNEGEYNGNWKNDMKNGKGEIIYKNKTKLEGDFIDDKREGDFIFTDINKNQLEIKFKNDKIIGEGIFRFYNKYKIIKGTFDDNFKLIKGILIDKNSEYEGDLNKEYNKEGKGKLKFKNGKIYEGEFKNDEMNGKGFFCSNEKDYKLLKDNKKKFDNKEIKEIFKLNINDFIFYGEFKNNIQKGNGIKYSTYNNNFFLNNIIYIGNFDKFIKNGKGKVYFTEEIYFDAFWKNDVKIDESQSGIFYLNESKIINETNSNIIWEKKIKKEILFYYGNNILKIISSNEIK